jgi:hypothetical protein
MISYIKEFEWNSLLGILLYWVPLAFCAVFYTVRSAQNYMRDKEAREKPGGYYVPSETVGALISRALVSVIPIANIWAAMFDLAPHVFGRLFRWLAATFSQPLVPDSPAAQVARKAQEPKATRVQPDSETNSCRFRW